MKKRIPWIVLMCVLICVAGLLAPLGAYYFCLRSEDAALRNVKQRIKSEGLPSTVGELFTEVPAESKNAAPLLQKAVEAIKMMPKSSPALRCKPGGGTEKTDTARLPEAEISALRKSLAEPAAIEALELLLRAGEKDKCNFSRDYSQGPAMPMPELGSMLSAVRILLNQAYFQARDGDTSGALNAIRAAMKISAFYRDEPLLIPWLVGITDEQMCLSAIMALLAKGNGLTAGQINGLEGAVETHLAMLRPSLVRALDGERILFGGSVFERLLTGTWGKNADWTDSLSPSSSGEFRDFFWLYGHFRPLLLADYAAYLNAMLDIRKMVTDPQPGGPDCEALIKRLPPTAVLTRITIPGFGAALGRLRETEVAHDLALIGLRAETFRIANGRFPRDLAELAGNGTLPADPFSGHAFVYKESGGDLLIYSVGPDGVNNGGNPSAVNKQKDIVWSVRRSPANAVK